jgi:hypothetical protein
MEMLVHSILEEEKKKGNLFQNIMIENDIFNTNLAQEFSEESDLAHMPTLKQLLMEEEKEISPEENKQMRARQIQIQELNKFTNTNINTMNNTTNINNMNNLNNTNNMNNMNNVNNLNNVNNVNNVNNMNNMNAEDHVNGKEEELKLNEVNEVNEMNEMNELTEQQIQQHEGEVAIALELFKKGIASEFDIESDEDSDQEINNQPSNQ